MKKFSVATITSILLLIGFVAGSIYYEKYKIEHIVKSDKVKEVVENMLKKQDDKALTPEGKIKSYKIDYDKVEKNPMGGISIDIIINDDEELVIGTIINKYDSRERYNLGALSFSPKLHKLLYEE
jgi:hypothetical protein